MKKIDLEVHKKILVELLRYIDKTCREHDIKYSLIGGSLIGAIRHGGIIPWDDDIDIALVPEDYKKLMMALSEDNDRYLLLNPKSNGKYPYPCAKLVDVRTVLVENHTKEIENYGVYVDIFKYHFVPNNRMKRYIHYLYVNMIKKMFGLSMLDKTGLKSAKNIGKILLYPFANLITPYCLKRIYMRSCDSKVSTDFVMLNWPAYGFEHEIQLKKNTEEYIDVKFEGLDVMIFKNYDEILRTIFGDYMKLPPEEDRVPKHNTKAWWKEGYEGEAEKLERKNDSKEKVE